MALARRLVIAQAFFLLPRAALAQEVPVAKPVDMFDGESSRGARVSPGLILKAEVAGLITYDSNVYNVDAGRTNDAIAQISPSFHLATDFPRHGLELLGGAQVARYAATSDENSEQYDLTARGKLELGYHIDVTAEAGIARKIEIRGTAGDQFATDRPTSYIEKHATFGISRKSPRIGIAVSGGITAQTFHDPTIGGVPIDMAYRDSAQRRAQLELSYRVSPKVIAFALVGINDVEYDLRSQPSRDSDGYTVLAGVQYQVSSLVDVKVAAGFLQQDFDDPLAGTAKGFSYEIAASWTPTPLWQLTASGKRAVDPSPLSNVPAIVRSDFKLKVQRAVRDRLLLEAGASYAKETYRGLGRSDTRYGGTATLRYRITDHIGAVAEVGYRRQDGGTLGRDYDGVSASLGLKVLL